jgi:hypothetical protein
MPMSTLPISKTLENYTIKLVHVTLPETINTPCNVAFEVTDPRDNIPMIHLGEVSPVVLYEYFREKNLLKRPMAGKAIGSVTTFPKAKRTWSRRKGATSVTATGT